MKRATFTLLFTILGPLAACFALASDRPNVIIMLMDDMGYNDIGVYTYPSQAKPGPPPSAFVANNGTSNGPNFARHLTPRIDSLASDGARFTHFYSTSSVCSPTRAAIMTGSYPARVGIPSVIGAGKNAGLNAAEVTLPELLRERGYLTAMSGKWHLGDRPEFNPVRHGFEDYFGILYSSDMWTANPYKSSWPDLDLMAGEAPLDSYTTSTGYTITGPIDTNEEQAVLLEAMTERAIASIDQAVAESRPFFIYYSPHTPHVPIHPHPDFLSSAGQTDDQARYADVIGEIDARVGAILDRVAQHGLENDTIIIFTSDNGPWQTRRDPGNLYQGAGSAYPFRGYKHSDWEGGHRVPFLVRYPGVVPPGVTLPQTAATHDIYATVAAFTGMSLPEDRTIDSIDIGPLLTGVTDAQPHETFYYYDVGAKDAAGIIDLTTPDAFKICVDNGKLYKIGEAFTGDFQERRDVSATYPNVKTALQERIEDWNEAMVVRPMLSGKFVQIELEKDSATVAEGGTSTIRVRLSGSATKTVNLSRYSGDADLSVQSGAILDFTPANWNQWQSVTFAAASDTDGSNGAATFRAVAPGLHLREIFVFEGAASFPAGLKK